MSRPGTAKRTMSPIAVRVDRDPGGHRRLSTARPVPAGEIVAAVPGIIRDRPSRYSIQVGERRHLDELGPVEATNHACDPAAFIHVAEDGRVDLVALRDLAAGDEVTIDYCATEWDMTVPFACDCGSDDCYGIIRGFRHLDPARRAALLPILSPHLRSRLRAAPLRAPGVAGAERGH